MSEPLQFHTVDVFTQKQFAGNPLAIVEGADGLDTATMQTIAREFNLSETIFIQTPEDPEHTAKVRIFFPTDEIPFAGHPTIGCAIHLAMKKNPGNKNFSELITLEEVAGLVPVHVQCQRGLCIAQFTAPVVPYAAPGKNPSVEMAAAALGLEPEDIGFDAHQPRQWQGGPTFLYVPVNSIAALERAKPKEPHWARMEEHSSVFSTYIYTNLAGSNAGFQARMYAPSAGIAEDAATGSASAILAAQLLDAGELSDGTNSYNLRQGYEMGRPSDIGLEVDVEDGKITAVRISGSSVPVSSGQLTVT
ncbi:MAG: PhzF family phenazine biosynthesis protein [Pseudomonadota bacterium]